MLCYQLPPIIWVPCQWEKCNRGSAINNSSHHTVILESTLKAFCAICFLTVSKLCITHAPSLLNDALLKIPQNSKL